MRSSYKMLLCCVAAAYGFALGTPAAQAGLQEWLNEVASGTPAGYSNTNITAPIVADIGTYNESSGISYEFIVNATNDGASSALLGNSAPSAVGDRSGLKWEQWQDTLRYGTTDFGVADFDSGVANTPGVDTHVVFVNNGTDTALWVNGALAATIAGSSPNISGTVGIGQVYSADANHFDKLTGTIIGVAIYDEALSGAEISAHSAAYFVPEPSAFVLAAIALASLGMLARRR